MDDDGQAKDDVRKPDGEVGEKIDKLFRKEEKDTSKFLRELSGLVNGRLSHIRCHRSYIDGRGGRH